MSVHIFQVLPHIKIGWTPVLRHLRTLLNVLFESFIASHQICLGNGFLPCLVLRFGFNTIWSILLKKKSWAYRQSFSAWRWAAEVIRPLHWDSKFDFECPRAVRHTWTKWHWKLVHNPYQHPPASCLRKKMLVTGFPVLVMNFQPLFADSLTSTLLDWLGYATGFSVLARLHSQIQLMLESVLNLYYSAVMMLEVMYETSLTSKRSSINPGPR